MLLLAAQIIRFRSEVLSMPASFLWKKRNNKQ